MSHSASSAEPGPVFDSERVRSDFPFLGQRVHGNRLVFLDTAASSQKPRQVIDAIAEFTRTSYANIHRGLYQLSARATQRYEDVRTTVARFIGATDPREIVFVRNATEAINLVMQSWGRSHLGEGDEILLTTMEHHANIVPWQMLRDATGCALRVAPIDDRGVLDLEALGKLLSPRTRLVALAHVSNVLGTVNPVREIVDMAHSRGIPVLVDGAQAVLHQPVNVTELDCDFYVFSGHKLYGPGAGVLYAKLAVLESMPPFLGGGSMIASVTFEKTTYAEVPHRFEAGTPDIASVIGLGTAIDYVSELGMSNIGAWEHGLLEYATEALESIDGLRIIGTAPGKAAVISFVLDGIHAHDVSTVLDQHGVAVRAGHHCAQPLMERFGVTATSRASLAIYNTREDVDDLVRAIHATRELLG